MNMASLNSKRKFVIVEAPHKRKRDVLKLLEEQKQIILEQYQNSSNLQKYMKEDFDIDAS